MNIDYFNRRERSYSCLEIEKTLNNECYDRIWPDSGRLAVETLRMIVPIRLPALARWALRTIEALPKDSPYPAAGYRDLGYDENANPVWRFPRSNQAERISVFLWLYRYYRDSRFWKAAIHYADSMLDPVYGLYNGPCEEARGQVWYWRDTGMYMTNYTMRVPIGMLDLYTETGNEKYKEAALFAGEALLRAQQENGILMEGVWPEAAPGVTIFHILDRTQNAFSTTNYKINSRIGYCVHAFAALYKFTEDPRYANALEKLSYALMRLQYRDGSIPDSFPLEGYWPIVPQVKNHFQSYVLNGCAAALKLIPDTPYLPEVTKKLGEYVVAHFRRSWGWACVNTDGPENDGAWARSSCADIAWAMANLTDLTGDSVYLETAAKLLCTAIFQSVDAPENIDFDGGIPVWLRLGSGRAQPDFGGYFHFFTLLGIREALKLDPEYQPIQQKKEPL